MEPSYLRPPGLPFKVTVPRETQIERLMKRDGHTLEDAENRIASQMPLAEKARRADFVVDNSGALEDLEQRVIKCMPSLMKQTWHRFNNLLTVVVACGVAALALTVLRS
eukprot:scaffold1021_cov241-Pinguiococcus_pyrenoidosus.AAC.5